MYAVIRESTIQPEAQERYAAASKELGALRAQQPGYRGNVSVDAGDARRVAITLWESEATQAAARRILEPHAERLLGPHWAVPATIVYQGSVTADDLVKGATYAIIRESTVQPEAKHGYDAASTEFVAILAQQPGYRGTMAVNAGDGRRARVVLWADEAASAASSLVMPAHSDRLLQPHRTGPSTIVYQGPVVADDRITH